jgi:hypothetical protein
VMRVEGQHYWPPTLGDRLEGWWRRLR